MNIPLVVDLDGTLLNTDILHESTVALFKANPLYIFKLFPWLCHGKAFLKFKIAEKVELNVQLLPYNQPLLNWLIEQKEIGRKLVLCTASNIKFANQIAAHLGIFSEVIASDQVNNLAGSNKAKVLTERYGEKGFDYAGNSKVDLHVWKHARRAVIVNGNDQLKTSASALTLVETEFAKNRIDSKTLVKTFRFHQWVKNILIFVPLFTSHSFGAVKPLDIVLSFLAFGACASSVYIANDLVDLENDREHPRKRYRPFASGRVSIKLGVLLFCALLTLSVLCASMLNPQFSIVLLIYFVITSLYSVSLKKVVLIDTMTLAILYTIRIFAGGAAFDIKLSYWLLAFSIFLFLSLAFTKRYAELHQNHLDGKSKIKGRGYHTQDAPLIQTFGVASGYISCLVLSLYINSENVMSLYKTPQLIWLAIPVILIWISWVWLKAQRGEMSDDPIVFAVKDRFSQIVGIVVIGIFIVASLV